MATNENEIPIENKAQISVEESQSSLDELIDQNQTPKDSYGIEQLIKVVALFLQEILKNITHQEIDKIENSIEEFKNKPKDEKIEMIKDNHLSSAFKDTFISTYIKEYENKVVEKNGAKLSSSEILGLKVPQAEQYIVSSVNFMKNKLEDSLTNKEDNNVLDKNDLNNIKKHKPKDDDKYDEDDDLEDNYDDIDNNSNGFRNFMKMETLKC